MIWLFVFICGFVAGWCLYAYLEYRSEPRYTDKFNAILEDINRKTRGKL